MSLSGASTSRQSNAATELFQFLKQRLNSPISISLWDGTIIPLADQVHPEFRIHIASPGAIATLLRSPRAETLLRLYAVGEIDYIGGDLLDLIETARVRNSRQKSRGQPWGLIARFVSAFILEKGVDRSLHHAFQGDETGLKRQQSDNSDFIRFHYDVSNEFYRLFLDEQMVYSCAYFHRWDDTLEQAQFNKLDMVCRKLQLSPNDHMLDIGCGWGALICHAARYYGVKAHGITLSEQQLVRTHERIRELGLEGQVTAEICDYANVKGPFDKISSVGMVEHVGIDNMSGYMQKVGSLLRDRGLFLNHGITRPGKMSDKAFRHVSAERRLLAKYIFPGGELDHQGHMIQCMESSGFEVHDVEGWRDHYALTCRLWCQRLEQNRTEAIRQVGEERYRLWLLYLTGCSLAFNDGGARLYQALATRHASKGASRMPCTREHLYADSAGVPVAGTVGIRRAA
ncbi:MAG: class I SAM-dependent methyltransferase [Planctomycetaceae bacterium]|nr:class I SAM-dependent methyltransferase [Planctomycetaceae bacterium]